MAREADQQVGRCLGSMRIDGKGLDVADGNTWVSWSMSGRSEELQLGNGCHYPFNPGEHLAARLIDVVQREQRVAKPVENLDNGPSNVLRLPHTDQLPEPLEPRHLHVLDRG